MIVEEEVDEFLEHHGVKGMKWGQRKKRYLEGRRLHKERLDRVSKGTASSRDVGNIMMRRLGNISLATTTIISGALLGDKLLRMHGSKSIRNIPKPKTIGMGPAKDVWQQFFDEGGSLDLG